MPSPDPDGTPPASDPASLVLTRHRPFQLFWGARVASNFGLQMQAVAVGWQMYDLTGSALELGLVGLFQFIPAAALVLIAGHVADRYDRRVVAGFACSLAALATATLAVANITGHISPALLFAMVFCIGASRAFEHPSVQSLLPSLVPAPALARAVAASSSAVQTATIVGPAAGGLLYAVSPTLVYTACAGLYATATLFVLAIHYVRPAGRREPVSLATLFGGVDFIRRNPIVLGTGLLDMFAVLLGGATALLPIFARDVFHTGPWGLGLMRAMPAIGALTMSLVLVRWPIRRRVGPKMYLAVGVFGIATVVFGLSSVFTLSLAALIAIGASDMVSVVIRQTLVQLETPDAMRGRVYAVNSLFIGTSNQLGEFESGATAAWFGTVPAVLIGGVGTLLIVLLWTRLFPTLYRRDRFESGPDAETAP